MQSLRSLWLDPNLLLLPSLGLVIKRYIDLVETVREELPRATLILTTVYDPTDGTGRLPGLDAYGRLPLEQLDRFNRQVRETADAMPDTVVADALSQAGGSVGTGPCAH